LKLLKVEIIRLVFVLAVAEVFIRWAKALLLFSGKAEGKTANVSIVAFPFWGILATLTVFVLGHVMMSIDKKE